MKEFLRKYWVVTLVVIILVVYLVYEEQCVALTILFVACINRVQAYVIDNRDIKIKKKGEAEDILLELKSLFFGDYKLAPKELKLKYLVMANYYCKYCIEGYIKDSEIKKDKKMFELLFESFIGAMIERRNYKHTFSDILMLYLQDSFSETLGNTKNKQELLKALDEDELFVIDFQYLFEVWRLLL